MRSSLFAVIVFCAFLANAALLPARFVVSEVVKNSGSGVYQIEQDVQFPTTGEPLTLRETWWVENENTMRLQVTGLRELKDQFRLQFVYTNGQRHGGGTNARIGADFIERYFHYRSTDRFLNDLSIMKILPANVIAKKYPRSVKDTDYKPETNVRLTRSGGALAYAFGVPSPVDGNPNPGFWIEQDVFVLRRFRLPSSVEVVSENFVQSPRGLLFPRSRTIRWGPNTVQIETLSVTPKTGIKGDFFQASTVNGANRIDGIQNANLKSLVEEFYMRFR